MYFVVLFKGFECLGGPLRFSFSDISMVKGRGCESVGSDVLLDCNNTIKLINSISLFMLCKFCCFSPKKTSNGFS